MLQKTRYSTADVAQLFSVTETTIKRWVSSGFLRCHTTPGGHRKFDPRDISEFARQHDLQPSGLIHALHNGAISADVQLAVLERDVAALSGAVLDLSKSTNRGDLHALFALMYENGFALIDIYDRVVLPAFSTLGAQWEAGEIDVAVEHVASANVLDAVMRLQTIVQRQPSNGRVAVCATSADDLHDLGLRCAANILEEAGWSVRYIGAQTPTDALVSAVRTMRPDLVCMSFSAVVPPRRTAATLRAVRNAVSTRRPAIVAGGTGAKGNLVSKGLCDAVCTSTAELKLFLEHRAKAGTHKNHEVHIA